MSRKSSAASQTMGLFGDAPIPLRPAELPPSQSVKVQKPKASTEEKEEKASKAEVFPFSVRPPNLSDVPRADSAPKGPCSGCVATAEGHYGVIAEDGSRTLPLCDTCGQGYHPTIREVWARADMLKKMGLA